ncbi:MAG TPA: Spy/CpxP family protein refolding chaperone [Accumulibacter sp.]|nr:Spy/CpxP family protein refolding chaperone [Accumulibacter sp.]HMW16232.1 Spy/CpxP family protein refolding chaperone [Accumulibacter sp.]HMX21417.1 Spy/CpxP family protein refolding chaperone [Accumulibacter sp.]HMY05911.1 Spy/CpxP family protein refolding chaperone [Accumulibacter sp.]HNC16743.1 Spy/CpxP family protein refolding chaperone [Accumulibacter sp.]
MNRKMKIALVAAFVASVGIGAGTVMADGRGNCGPFGKDMRAVAEKKLSTLHEQLKLTPAQEPAWSDFRGTIQAQAGKVDERFREKRDATSTMTALERLERGQQGLQERQQALAEITNATRRFYGTLDREQQQRFDEAARHFGPGGFHPHGPRLRDGA